MAAHDKEQLLHEIRDAQGRLAPDKPLTALIQRWLECQDAQAASQALARALSLQTRGEPMWPGPGIWPLVPG
jgi:hypothetical protein